ncbi:MAG: DUF3352 domain-containing protein [Chloroflexi bacterium]|nr:DUF3352 domain-containing protein [Chloroflexota bacterium]
MTDQRPPDPLIGEDAVPPPAFEPADSLPAARVDYVSPADGAPAGQPARGRSGVRWLLALAGVIVVAVGTALIVSLAGARPVASTAIGWMPPTTTSYTEVRLDLPGDQRQKLAAFLSVFPGFKDQSQIEPKLNDVLDRIVRAASGDKQTWTTDIQPWFGGQIALGMGAPGDLTGMTSMMGMAGGDSMLVVATITDKAKAIDWLTRTTSSGTTPLTRSTHGAAELFTVGSGAIQGAVAITDKAMIAGFAPAVKAAVDSNGAGTLADNAEIKAALATIDKDYVFSAIVRTRAQFEAMTKAISASAGNHLDGTQLDETVLAMVPAWSASTARFENDSIVASSSGPSWAIGVDTANRASQLLGHVPAKTVVYFEYHDLGPAIQALVAKFRALPETKQAFDQADQALSLLGGLDAVIGWWGDTAVVVAPAADGTIGGGLVIKPRDAAAAERLSTTLSGFLAIGGSSAGLTSRFEDHNGTKVTILDLSGVPGAFEDQDLPAGYKAEIAWATNADVTVIGYGQAFVHTVLDAGPGTSLGEDARFKALLERAGADNISTGFVDIAGIRALTEPLMQQLAPADEWTKYTTEIKPYLERLDALIGANRKDGTLDRGSTILTVR